MRSKRLFAFLLVFCMVFTTLAAPVSAVAAPEMSVVNAEKNTEENNAATKTETSPKANGLIVSENAGNGLLNLRENSKLNVEVENSNDENSDKIEWNVTPAEGAPSISLLPSQEPECLEELRKAAELYSVDEVVYAFVVMEDKPLAEAYTSRRLVSAEMEKQMIQKQDAVISTIERMILGGEKLEVRYQFTYLTNSFTIKTAFGNLEKIANLEGVKSVFLTPVFEPTTTATPNTAAAGAMTGVHNVWENLGYTGTGMKIAIIDTGLDLDHPSFAADPETNENSLTVADINAVLADLNAYARRATISGETLYRSAKIPFAFNYVDASLSADHSRDMQGDHGTHVAGIAAANATEGTTVVGMAPDAQIIVMKVFGAAGGAYMDDVAAALEDAMTLGCDVVNASLGSARGFSSSSDAEIDLIYERLASQDIIATFSAGNEGTSSYGNMWGTDLNRTQNPDNAAIGSPSTWVNTLSIASAENSEVMTDFFALADGTQVFFQDSMPAIYKDAGYEDYLWAVSMKELADVEFEYVIVPGLGSAEDVAAVDVAGKIAVIHRGTLSFAEKIMNAELAGAAGVIIWNTNDTDDIFSFGMGTSEGDYYPAIPAALVTLTDGQKMADAETKTMIVSAEQAARQCEGGQMSSFSSWGVTPDLQLMPDITGIGGNVYSCYDGGQYGLMSGTSMSAPQIAGVAALVMQHLYTIYPDAPDGTIRNLAEAILMSTADPIISSVSGVEASPRQQGAGLVNAYEATTTTTYLTVGGNRPKAELGDNANGSFTFSFEIHNIGAEDKTYTLDSSLLTEYVAYAAGEYFMYGENIPLSGSVTFDKDTVTVPAGGRASVTASIQLSDEDKAYFAAAWENGGYVEGYVYLYNEEGASELNLPFLGFYGDWTDAPVFDTAYWYDNSFWGIAPANGLPEGDEYYHVLWTDLAGTDWVMGFNAYSGAMVDNSGNVVYDSAYNVVSPNGDGVLDGITEIYLSLLRNAKTLTFTYTVDGEVVHQEVITDNPKTMYVSAYGQVVPWIYSWYGWDIYDFTGKDGKPLPNGTEVLLTIDGYVDYGTGGDNTIQIPITVDTQAPELVNVYELPQANDQDLLFVELRENIAPAAVVLMNPTGTRVLAQDYFFTNTGNGTYIIGFDITGMGTEFMVALCDYACNESYYNVVYTADPDGNLPNVDTSLLYGYRVYDDVLYSDHMYGWIATNKPASGEYANVSVLTDDYLEYAAITAAEYAGGKVFAVDAVYNFVVMDPGLWNRNTICNLGMSVLDMAFDDVTDTMYVLAKDEWNYSHLYTIDLLTGELTYICEFDYYNYGPWAITFDATGTMYAIKVGSSNLYTVDVTTGEMTVLTDAEGNDFEMTLEDGSTIAPTAYSQSITYSEADDTIYFAHFQYSWWGSYSGMAAINMADLTTTYSTYAAQAYDTENNLVDYYPQTEIVGLMVLEETDYTIPEATELQGIVLDAESIIMNLGESAQLTASPNPWNYELGNVTWTSSDEAVATVEDGKITAAGEGTAVITASVGDLTASCTITVINVQGHFYAYNYYSGDGNYGYMIDVDMGSMNYSLTAAPGADFITGDYNGHDGCFYGYTENGQFYRYDFETDETVALGAPITSIPTDMAYDYSTGLMYAMTIDTMSGYSVLNAVNLKSGALEPVAYMYYNFILTLACDLEGNLYGIDYAGNVLKLHVADGYMEGEYLIFELGSLNYAQSMCYDHNNDVLIWGYPEASIVYWIDVKADEPYAVALGDPTASGFEFVGMYTVPAEIPELGYVAVESVSADHMTMLVGTTKTPDLAILPFNATVQTAQLVSDNEAVLKVNADGTLTAVSEGVATITGSLVDGETTYDISFTVTVIQGADNIYGHVMTDVATYAGQYWIRLYPQNTSDPDLMEFTDYIIYAEEYYDGNLYAVGYDAYDYSGNWQMFVLDPVNHSIKEQWDLGTEYPFIYDMTYDYATSTMYCVAGPSDTASDLYVMDMETGAVTLLMETEQFFMSLAASPDGTLYAMEPSEQAVIGYDDWGWEIYGYTNTLLYAIDPVDATIELVGDTGMKCNMLASMSYDYDTDRLYWTPMFQGDSLVSGLAIVDPVTGIATNLGAIGGSGAQVSGLYIVCDNFPEEAEPALHNMLVNPGKTVVNTGNTVQVTAVTLPMNLETEVVWTSSNEKVATVDENGVVTGVSQGKAEITATVSYNGVTMVDSCTVAVLAADASFLTYNLTDGGWSAISRADALVVTNLTEGEEIAVAAIATAGADVYGYDVDNNLFSLNTKTYERTIIGSVDAEKNITDYLTLIGYGEDEAAEIAPYYAFEIRDMAYDAANDRYLVLGNVYDSEWGEVEWGNGIYEVDLTDGTLTLLYTIEDLYNCMAMTVDAEGFIYYYCAYDDSYTKLDLATGETKVLSNVYTLGFYGSTDHDHAMYYDDLTGLIYHAFTSNGTFYRLLTLDPANGTISVESTYIGDVEYNYDTWRYDGDAFAGLGFVMEEAPEYTVEWKAVNTTLASNIGLNYYVVLSANIVNDPAAYVEFSVAGKTINVPVAEAIVSVKDGVTRYRFSCELNAKQMSDNVTAQVCTANGPVGQPLTYSIAQYCNGLIDFTSNGETVALMKAMLNFGAAAQMLLNYNTDNLANAELSDADKVLDDVDASAFAHKVIGEEDGIVVKSANLLLESETTIKIHFQLTGEKSIDAYTFTIDGVEVTPVDEGNNKYFISLSNLGPRDLDEMHTFAVGGLSVEYCGLSYVNQVMDYSTNELTINIAKALYAYYTAAEVAFN